ncbi:MAG: hypothetical protein A2Y33_06450 [Spirochaetes bacterium GWF1_51_8]|nr:MAG: hypothetical protein A2Y33_06450 [Spirochaetes bacterium GWF1_51_8]
MEELLNHSQDIQSSENARTDAVIFYPLEGRFQQIRCENHCWVAIKRKEKRYVVLGESGSEKHPLDFDDSFVVFDRVMKKEELDKIIPPLYSDIRISYGLLEDVSAGMKKNSVDAKVYCVVDHSANESNTITIKSSLNAVSMTIDLIKNKVLKYHYDKIWKIETVLHEALVNSITYGNELDYNKPVILSYEIGYKGIRMWIRDMGDGFDVENITVPMGNEALERISGRGIYIMKKFSEAFFFNKKGNEMLLFFEF